MFKIDIDYSLDISGFLKNLSKSDGKDFLLTLIDNFDPQSLIDFFKSTNIAPKDLEQLIDKIKELEIDKDIKDHLINKLQEAIDELKNQPKTEKTDLDPKTEPKENVSLQTTTKNEIPKEPLQTINQSPEPKEIKDTQEPQILMKNLIPKNKLLAQIKKPTIDTNQKAADIKNLQDIVKDANNKELNLKKIVIKKEPPKKLNSTPLPLKPKKIILPHISQETKINEPKKTKTIEIKEPKITKNPLEELLKKPSKSQTDVKTVIQNTKTNQKHQIQIQSKNIEDKTPTPQNQTQNNLSKIQDFTPKTPQNEPKNIQTKNIQPTIQKTIKKPIKTTKPEKVDTEPLHKHLTLETLIKKDKKDKKNSNPQQNQNQNNLLTPTSQVVNELKANIAKAKESIKHFATNLKEAIDNYKPPISKISLEMHPQELGKVEVTLIKRGDNLQIQINSNNQAVNFLNSQQQELRQNLINMGFTQVNMSFNSHQEKQQNQHHQQYKQNQNLEEEDELIIEIPYTYA